MKINGRPNQKGTEMAEQEKWGKWEGPGEPEGKGGMSSPESSAPDDVEGRAKKGSIACYKCGASCSMCDEDWRWFTCWNCGEFNYNFDRK